MLITKMCLPRRAVLRGMGTTLLGLPFLDAMVAAGAKAAAPPLRFGVAYLPMGVNLPDWMPTQDGSSFVISPILKPLAPFHDQLTIISGLANAEANSIDGGSGPHSRCCGTFLSGARTRRTERADIHAGTTIDQFAARELGKETPLRSLELALEPNFMVGNCDGGYSCAYINTISWRTPTAPLPMETNPRAVFERLFGDGDRAGMSREARTDRSILDSVEQDLARLQRRLGPADRRTMDEYLGAIRDVERRLQLTESENNSPVDAGDRPFAIPSRYEDHAKIMFDLMYLAYRADMTRVVTFQVGRELSMRSFPEIGVPAAHHDVSHHGDRPEVMANKAKIDTFEVRLFSHLVTRMAGTPDGDGSLLDHSLLLLGSSMGNGNNHSPHNLPIALVGKAGGKLKAGRHVKPKFNTPFMNLGLSLLDIFGVHLDQISDSTGRLTEL